MRKRFDFSGNWEIVDTQKQKTIVIHSNSTYKDYNVNRTYTVNGIVNSHKVGFSLEISVEGVFEDNKPYYLFVWIGDPDDMNKYKFVKQ